ncbi:genetic suppressor element 1 isoform X2 [Pyxicephalus adspersus]|uniref:genetic suppressor element 1 isoform X2 n=1 Tax=Pyxicephalus adspersus TaxID=30357 RepID=UPI003B59B984
MSDPAGAPISRKQRLMAAVEEEEGCAPGSGVVYCFICGGGVPRGREVQLSVRCPNRDGYPFFPFLQQQEPAPGAEPISPSGCARVCQVCQRFLGAQWDTFERSRTPLEKRMYWLKRPYQCGEGGARANPRDWNPHYDSDLSDLSDRHLSETEEGPPTWTPPLRQEKENGHPSVCYICGGHNALHTIYVQKQENSPETPFFPFLWVHAPPPGAQPISASGSARACASCFPSLLEQWQDFEMANVPILQRAYMVPIPSGDKKGAPLPDPRPGDPQGKGKCYMCGEDCANQGKMMPLRITNGNAKSTMHFPFIAQFPCPQGARGVSEQGEVLCCRLCHRVLEDVWGFYLASQNAQLIETAMGFLSRYQQVFDAINPNQKALGAHTAPPTICYVCGAEMGPCAEYQLSINPPSRSVDKEPFFPFLTVYPPAPRAKPPDSMGLVSTCSLCYHDLLGQWMQHEMGTQQPNSPWSRQYQVKTFVCFLCLNEKKRKLGLRTMQLARLPVFILTPKPANSLFVDNGDHVLVGVCTDCRPAGTGGLTTIQGGSVILSLPTASQMACPAPRATGPSGTKAQQPESKPVKLPPPSSDGGSNVERVEPSAAGMNHEPKSASIGMLSTATRTTATVSPLTPSPINGSLVPNGSPAASSALSVQSAPSSSFAAALRKLAKQAEEPRGSSISSESSPVSSPATNHSSPASTPKRGPMGPIIVPPGGHSVPNTPPVVTIAPTKTVNGVWRSEARQSEGASRASSLSRERLLAESQMPPEKAGTPSIPSHLLGNAYAFAIPPSSVVQDSRFPLNLQRPVPHVVPQSAVTEEYLRSFRPYHTAEDLRMPSIPHLGLDPAAAAYYHNTYLAAHHPFPHPAFRMDESYCLSALRSPFYPLHSPGSLPPLHPSAMHLHLSGVRYPADLTHSSLSALQSERISSLTAERLQMDEELRQREREREREREKEREADREREKEREREREREREKKELEREKERERERELERQRERAREKEATLLKNLESQFLAESELHPLRSHQEERMKPTEQPPSIRPEKLKESSLQTAKPVPHSLHPPPATHHAVPSLISTHAAFPQPNSAAAAALLAQRTQEEEKWLARQRRLRQEKEDRQFQVSEFRQQVLEQQLDITGRPIPQPELELRPENLRVISNRNESNIREPLQHFGGPPPLISPKPQQQPTPTSLWNPVTLMEHPTEPRRTQEPNTVHNHPAAIFEHNRQAIAPVKIERPYSFEKQQQDEEEVAHKRREQTEKYQPNRDSSTLEHAGYSHAPFLAELEKSTQSFLNQQRSSLQQAGQTEITLIHKPITALRAPPPRTRESMYVYDEFLQQHRRLVSKLDMEERRRKEAREKGYYYDLDDSYDESDEEEVRAHLRRVAEQPPLKLDTSSEKLEFLKMFGLTTQQEKERVLQEKRRKRRRMFRERSQSPPMIQNKRQTPSPHSPLSTRFTPEELNNSPNLEEKKKFLTFFDLSHVSTEKRKDKEKLMEMLEAIKQKNAAPEAQKNQMPALTRASPPPPPLPASGPASEDQPAAPPSIHPEPPAPIASTSTCTVPVPEPVKPLEPIRPDQPKLLDSARVPPLPLPVQPPVTNVPIPDKIRLVEAPPKKSLSILNFVRGHPPKENLVQPSQSMNGRNKTWEPFMAEEFAHQFHESVLQSTQKALQKHKGGSGLHIAELNHKSDASVHYNIPELQKPSRAPSQQQNGQPGPGQPGAGHGLRQQDVTSAEEVSEEEEDEEEDEDEDEPPRPKWQGIEAIFEAYQEHLEEQNLERQVLESQCKRLEAQHYNLSLTAEQLSHRMADLMSQKQRISSERDRLQAELEHFRKCLVLPSSSWSRGYFKGHPR